MDNFYCIVFAQPMQNTVYEDDFDHIGKFSVISFTALFKSGRIIDKSSVEQRIVRNKS